MACGDGDARWCPVMLVAVGPEAPNCGLQALGGASAEGDGEAGSSFTEDGRLHMATSGLCLWDSASPTVAVTSVALVAPFLRRSAATKDDLCTLIDPELVATTELFAVFPPANEPTSVQATLLAAVPLPDAEQAAADIQASLNFPATPSTSSTSPPCWKPPPLGSMGMVLLRLAEHQERGCRLRSLDVAPLCVGDCVRLLSSPFALLKASMFLGMQAQGFIAASEESAGIALLDARQLPGACGGVLVRESEPDQPVALMAPTFGAGGQRWPLNPVISLQSILSAFLATLCATCLPPVVQRIKQAPAPDESALLGRAQKLLCPLTVFAGGQEATVTVLLLSPYVLLAGPRLAAALYEPAAARKPWSGRLLGTEGELLPCAPLTSASSAMLLRVQGKALKEAITSRLLDAGEGAATTFGRSELLAVDLDATGGPFVARGYIHQWLGLRHRACPAIRFGLPKPGGLSDVHAVLSTRPLRPLALVLHGLKEELPDVRVLPLQFRALLLDQLQDVHVRLKNGAPQASIDSWLLHFDNQWRELVQAGPGSFDWRLEARPVPALTASL